MKPTPATSQKDIAGKRYRLVVRSAEEAVRVIREKLGDQAKVLSVRQVGGEGLKRFISSPKLEVIAEMQPSVSPSHNELEEVPDNIDHNIAITQPNSLPGTNEVISNKYTQPNSFTGKEDNVGIETADDFNNETLSLLSKTGFDQGLIKEIQSWSNWEKIKDKPLADALKEITIGLSDRYGSTKKSPTSHRIALVGSPGVGKTTTLCKFLAHEVFMNKSSPSVLKVENGVPNPDDALRIFCEVVGVTLYREKTRIPDSKEDSPLYLDLPGLSLKSPEDWSQASATLDELDVSTRVLVINGAYDREILFKNIQAAKHLGATHLAITHFDEIANSTKLWPLLLRSDLTPLCICNGQNVTGDFTTSVLNQMISRTFPEELYAKGFSSYQRL